MPEPKEPELEEETRPGKLFYAIRGIPVIFFLVYIYAFRTKFLTLWQGLQVLYGSAGVVPSTFGHDFLVLFFTLAFGFGAIFILWMVVISEQTLLPVQGLSQILQTARYLWTYVLGLHGQAVFVRNGKIQGTSTELRRIGPGVIVVDFNSAVVMEGLVYPPTVMMALTSLLQGHPIRLGAETAYQATRVLGAGVVFTSPAERIRGIADLRSQFRINEKQLSTDPEKIRAKIRGYTRDGIELATNVNALFTIGQEPDPDALQVCYDGEHRPENLKVMSLQKLPDGLYRLNSLSDDLDEEDQREIHAYGRVADRLALSSYIPLPSHSPIPVFNPDRVFRAIFSEARTSSEDLIHWVYLPSHVAIDLFRKMLAQINYDDLYSPDSGDDIESFKKRFKAAVRNTGLLSYRMVYHCSGMPFIEQKRYAPEELLVSPIRHLTSHKVLRDRGIKIIASGFGDLIPVSEAVYKQRLDSWRAPWERDTGITQARMELEAMRVRSRARAQAQHELALYFSQILQKNDHSKEVLAVRVFQALETLAANPATRQLLPGNTVNLMRNLHDWLLPGDGLNPPGP